MNETRTLLLEAGIGAAFANFFKKTEANVEAIARKAIAVEVEKLQAFIRETVATTVAAAMRELKPKASGGGSQPRAEKPAAGRRPELAAAAPAAAPAPAPAATAANAGQPMAPKPRAVPASLSAAKRTAADPACGESNAGDAEPSAEPPAATLAPDAVTTSPRRHKSVSGARNVAGAKAMATEGETITTSTTQSAPAQESTLRRAAIRTLKPLTTPAAVPAAAVAGQQQPGPAPPAGTPQ